MVQKAKRTIGNRIEIEGDVVYLYLNQEDDKEPFLFDVDDLDLVRKYTVVKIDDRYAGAYDKVLKRNIYLHRVIMDMIGKPSRDFVDHLNGNVRDNRKCNLRICHEDDAANQTNVTYDFSPFKVVKERLSDDRFRLLITNGIVQDFEIIYYSFDELIKDYKYLKEQGVDKGFFKILRRIEANAILGLQLEEQGTDAYLECYSTIQMLEDAYKEIEGKIKLLKGIGRISKDELLVKDNVMYFSADSKVIRLVHNVNDSDLAGLHERKPNGSLIYKD